MRVRTEIVDGEMAWSVIDAFRTWRNAVLAAVRGCVLAATTKPMSKPIVVELIVDGRVIASASVDDPLRLN